MHGKSWEMMADELTWEGARGVPRWQRQRWKVDSLVPDIPAMYKMEEDNSVGRRHP